MHEKPALKPALDAILAKGAAHMTTFDERKDRFEKKFAHDEELKFRAVARRNRLLGLWAAATLGKAGDAAAAYAKEIVAADFEPGGGGANSDRVLRKLAHDLTGMGITEHQVQQKMLDLLDVAIEQIKAGT
jgi:hypothetical protein